MATTKWSAVLRGFSAPLQVVWIAVGASKRPVIRASGLPFGASVREHSAHWSKMLDVLELVALIAVADPDGWLDAVNEIEGATTYAQGTSGGSVLVDSVPMNSLCLFDSSGDEDGEEVPHVLRMLSTPVAPGYRSEAFQSSRAAIIDMAPNEAVRAACEALQLPVSVVVQSAEGLDAVLDWQESVRGRASRTKLVTLELVLAIITRELVTSVRRTVEAGIPFESAVLQQPRLEEPDEILTRAEQHQLIMNLFGPLGPRHFNCRNLGSNWPAFEVVFSALLTPKPRPQSLDLLGLSLGDASSSRRSGLLWLLYSVFSQYAMHSVRRLSMHIFQRELADDLRWLEHLLQLHSAPRPELFLEGAFNNAVGLDDTSPVEKWIAVHQELVVRSVFDDNSRQDPIVVGEGTHELRVLRDDGASEFIDVLVPGYGRCWIERSGEVQVISRPREPWDLSRHSVRNLDVRLRECSHDELDIVATLLRLVGAPLQELRLNSCGADSEGITALAFIPILEACPVLTSLTLVGVKLRSVDSLLELFNHETCRVQALTVTAETISSFHDLSRLGAALEGDAGTAISYKLREISVDLRLERGEVEQDTAVVARTVEEEEAVMLAWLSVLSSNYTLKYLHFSPSQAQRTNYRDLLLCHHGEPLHLQKAPLPLRSRCALLSVAAQINSILLHRDIMGRVFQLAAEPETRVVRVSHA